MERYQEKLRNFEMFNKLTEDEVNRFFQMVTVKDVGAGEYIIHEHDTGKEMYLLLSGSIQVLKTTAYNDEYVCYEFSSDANYLFGEMAMLDEGLRSASIRTTSPCVVGVIQAEDFQNFCEKDLQAGYKLMWYLSRKVCGYLRKDNEDLVTLFQALLEEIERE